MLTQNKFITSNMRITHPSDIARLAALEEQQKLRGLGLHSIAFPREQLNMIAEHLPPSPELPQKN